MEIEDYNYEKNSNTISKEERDAFILSAVKPTGL